MRMKCKSDNGVLFVVSFDARLTMGITAELYLLVSC